MSMRAAIQDVIDGAKNYQFWMTFGLNDIKAKYRRSKLGQWWITLSVAVFIFVIGGLYRSVFDADASTYLAYLAVGYITWLLIQDSLITGTLILAQAKPFLVQRSWPVSTFIYRLIYREILIFAHHVILLPPIFLWLKLWPGLGNILLSLAGLALTIFSAFWTVLFLSIISLRYRDFPPIVQSLMRMAFFATPIIWIERNLGAFGEWVVLLNPFGYFLKIIRDPLLGGAFSGEAWIVSVSLAIAVAVLALITLSATKDKLSYWL